MCIDRSFDCLVGADDVHLAHQPNLNFELELHPEAKVAVLCWA
jgi:hypothetical protein